jgi:hypothetical protein
MKLFVGYIERACVSGICYYHGHTAENRIDSVKVSSVEL